MATNDIRGQVAGSAVNMGIGRGLGELGLRSPVPLPSFYNGNSEHPWADSQANRMLHGNRAAWKGYGRNLVDRTIGGAIAGPLGAAVAPWVDRHFVMPLWNGIKGVFNRDSTPHGTVTVGDINTTGDNGMQATINPTTGQVSYMPTFSNYGPYSAGYQGLDDGDTGPVMPDFSHYSETGDEAPAYEGPYSPQYYGFAPANALGSFQYSQAGGGSGAGVWNGGGGMHSYTVNSGSLNQSNYSGIDPGQGRKKGTSPRV